MITYRLAEEKDLQEIALIHTKAFPDYFLTAFGKDLLYKFYESYLKNKQVFIVAEKEDKVIGFILGNSSDISRKEFFNENFYKIVFKIISELLKGNKILWKGMFQRLFFIKEAILSKINKKSLKNEKRKNNLDISYDLLSIAVDQKERGNNTAFEMEKYFCNRLKEKNIITVKLSVKKENMRAINFYKKCDYKIAKTKKELIYFTKNIKNKF